MKDLMSAMRSGQVVIGPFCVSSSPAVVEVIGYSGADFVIIDCEHASLSPYGAELENMVRAAYASDITPLVRVTMNEPGMILKALDFGAKGVVVPHVNSKEEAAQAVRSARFPPKGSRSCTPSVRATSYGWESWREYVDRTNNEIMVLPIFEEPSSLDHIEEILSVDGIDVAFFGPYDLAERLGGVGTQDAEEAVERYLEKMIRVCNAKGIPVMNLAWTVEQTDKWVRMGCRGIAFSTDISLLNQALKEDLKQVREKTSVTLPPLT